MPVPGTSAGLKKVVVIGCSGHAKVVIDIIERQGLYKIAGLLDSYKPWGTTLSGYQVIGTCDDVPALMASHQVEGGIVAIGDNWQRSKIVEHLTGVVPEFPFITAVHPSVQIGADVEIGRGTVVMAGAVINPGCKVGDFCIVNTRASLDHDSVMGDFSSLAPAATTGGNVQIGAFSVVAIGAIVLHDIRIGEHTVIGAGATVLKDIPDSVVTFGTPARIIRKRNPGDIYLTAGSKAVPRSLSLFPANSPNWGALLERTEHDFFHTAAYHQFSQESGEGEGWLAVYGDGDRFFAWPYLLRRIENADVGGLSRARDVTSAYGYIGPLAYGCSEDDAFLGEAWNALVRSWRNQGVVSVFTRFHPLLHNHRLFEHLTSSEASPNANHGLFYQGQTVAIDLLPPAEEGWKKYKRQLRQHIQRAERLGLVSSPDPEWKRLDDFVHLYHLAMQRNHATPFYFFSTEYFQRLRRGLEAHGSLMVTQSGDHTAAAGLLIEYGGIATAHLAAPNDDFCQLSPCKTLLHHAQLWARQRGNRFFHIGGGRGAREDDPLSGSRASSQSSTILSLPGDGFWIRSDTTS